MWARLQRLAGNGTVNKMWAGAIAPALLAGGFRAAEIAFGVEIDETIKVAALALITGGAVWRVPNRG